MPENTDYNSQSELRRPVSGNGPRDLGDFFELKGKKLEWKAGSAKNKMEVIIHDE